MTTNKKFLCSAGITHFTIFPSGDYKKCNWDWNYKTGTIGNLLQDKEIKFLSKDELVCPHNYKTVSAAVQQCYCKRNLQFDLNGNTANLFSKNNECIEKNITKVSDLSCKKATIELVLNTICNYNCPYCHNSPVKPTTNGNIKNTLIIVKKLFKQFDVLNFRLALTEPTLAVSFVPFVKFLYANKNKLNNLLVLTNMSKYKRVIKAAQLLKEKLTVCGSIHILENNFNPWHVIKLHKSLVRNECGISYHFIMHPLVEKYSTKYEEFFKFFGIKKVHKCEACGNNWRKVPSDFLPKSYSIVKLLSNEHK